MKRAAILIGVDKTGDLPRLKDAARGARLMETWAQAQGLQTVVLTDETEPVTVDAIKRAVRKLVDAANIGQLLVYFAGHGVNLQRQEHWLLTDAPDDTQAAVNVATSAALAATCGIPHVVLMSDACRTAPEGIRAQSLRGSEIFPNREEDMRPVDQFFACQLGKPSHEVRDPAVTAAEFQALYTHELVPALLGQHAELVEWVPAGAARRGFVRPRPLRDHLSAAVAARIAGLQMQTRLIQVPVAQISSDPPAWLSELEETPAAPPSRRSSRGRGPAAPGPAAPAPTPVARPPAPGLRAGVLAPAPQAVAADLLRATLRDGGGAAARRRVTRGIVGGVFGTGAPAAGGALERDARRLARPFGPTHHETGCGFKLRGAGVVDVLPAELWLRFPGDPPLPTDDVRIQALGGAPRQALLVLDSGAGVLLPVLPEYLCALSVDDDGELVDVAYEPSEYSRRWPDFLARAEEIRMLRGIAAAAMSQGSFKLEGGDALALARRMQLVKGADPSMALYAAYAFHELQRHDLLREMAAYLRDDLGAPLFDVALLARELDRSTPGREAARTPIGALPLLSLGWSLMRAFEVRLAPALAPLEGMRLPSLWTMFDARGVEHLRGVMGQGALR